MVVSIPIISFPYSLEGAPCLKRHLFYGFLFCPGNGRPFFLRPRHPHAYTATVKTKMKNSTLAAKTIFYPLAWPSFTLRPPVQSIPAIIASLSSPHHTHALGECDDVMRPKTRWGFFPSFSYIFFPLASLKNQFGAIYIYSYTCVCVCVYMIHASVYTTV